MCHGCSRAHHSLGATIAAVETQAPYSSWCINDVLTLALPLSPPLPRLCLCLRLVSFRLILLCHPFTLYSLCVAVDARKANQQDGVHSGKTAMHPNRSFTFTRSITTFRNALRSRSPVFICASRTRGESIRNILRATRAPRAGNALRCGE